MPKLKIAHWVLWNSSGMFRVAESFSKQECLMGVDSWLVDFADEAGYEDVLDADIHVVHTHLPDKARMQFTKPERIVWVAHGTPEYVFRTSVEEGLKGGYGASDSWQLCQYWMQNADASVTFWPRHQKIWKSLCDKHTNIDCIDMGLDLNFWKPTESRGKFLGEPSLFTAENCDSSKWPLDLFLCWPWVYPKVPTAHLHAVYLPVDQHRWFYPLMNRNGCGFKTISSAAIFDQSTLRNAFCSTDFFIGLVRYGDANRLSLEAAASGVKMITYAGNPYSDYWIREGDQRDMAKQIIKILSGKAKPRKNKKEVVSIAQTTTEMIKIYERVMRQ